MSSMNLVPILVLTDWQNKGGGEVVVGEFSSSVLFVINWCRFVLEGVIIIGVV